MALPAACTLPLVPGREQFARKLDAGELLGLMEELTSTLYSHLSPNVPRVFL